ncbi:MAG: 4Fe-4S dicluster domain-containing protein [Candidatus Omnitrophica bacterium]|nr:4Fe-4S dicluster domain-containing protein [Candidatus Omnitrophota bacterium]
MDTLFLKSEDFFKFLDRISLDYELYVPCKINTTAKVKCDFGFSLPAEDYFLEKYTQLNEESIIFNEYRSIEPARTYFTPCKEEVSQYFCEDKKAKERPLAVYGIKNCDIFSLKIQDWVFLGPDVVDQQYKERRQSALIISGDCTAFKEACFCRAFDINPFVEEGFDFNLSPLNNGFLVDIATQKAKDIADSIKEVFSPATAGQLSGRASKRELVVRRLEEHLAQHKIPKKETLKDIVTSGYSSKIWQEQMKTCVECGGCVFMCDTCHCFLLSDEPVGENARRLRLWDGCLFKNFTLVAGGANPLKMRYMRLRNRYLKKFDFFIDNMGIQACCGCGRCIDVCPGKIDIRYILRRLYEEKYIPAA